MIWLLAGLIVFLGLHSLRMVAPQWRQARIDALDKITWMGLYSVVALSSLVLLIWGYAQARPDAEILYVPAEWSRHVAMLLMAFAFIFLMIFNLKPGRLKARLKHPFLISIKTWALAHLLANGDAASVLLFGSFLVWAILNRISVGRRAPPDHAIGPVTNDIIAVVCGLAIWVLFIWKAHEWLIGVAPIV